MNPKIIDGIALANKHEEALKEKLESLKKDRNPSVVSFCNQDDPPSVKYTFMKLQKASDLGVDFIAEEFSANTPKEYLVSLIQKYNQDQSIDGIMVQLPLPDELNLFKEDLVNLIDPKKDVDGLRGDGLFLSATALGVMSILDSEKTDYSKVFVIVGSEGQVGREIVKALKEKNAQIIEIGQKIPNSNLDEIKKGDVVISCAGSNNLILPEFIKEGAVLVDVGLGDFDPKCYEKASKYTPITGGVGPMTVISLMENVVESYQRNKI